MLSMVLSVLLLVLAFSPQAQAASESASFARHDEADQALRATWARLIAQALRSGKTPYEISRYFPKASPAQVKELKYLPAIEHPPITVMRTGNSSLLFKERGQLHRLEVAGAYPDLNVKIDKRLVSFPMTNKKALDEALRKWLKESSQGNWAKSASLFDSWPGLFAEAHAQGGEFVAGLALGALATSAARSYYGRRDRAVVNNFVSDGSGSAIADRLEAINTTLDRMTEVNEELAAVQIPDAEMSLANRVEQDQGADEEDKSVAKDLRKKGRADAQKLIAKEYGPILGNLRNYLGAKSSNQFQECRDRSVGGSYSLVKGTDTLLPVTVLRRAKMENMDSREITIGDTTIKVALVRADEGRKFAPYNEAVGKAEICQKGKCQQVQSDKDGQVNLDDVVRFAAAKQLWKKMDLRALEREVRELNEKFAGLPETCSDAFERKHPLSNVERQVDCYGGPGADWSLGLWHARARAKRMQQAVDALHDFQEAIASGEAGQGVEGFRDLVYRLSNAAPKEGVFSSVYSPEFRRMLEGLRQAIAGMDEQMVNVAETLTVSAEHEMCCQSNYCRGRLTQLGSERKALESDDEDSGIPDGEKNRNAR